MITSDSDSATDLKNAEPAVFSDAEKDVLVIISELEKEVGYIFSDKELAQSAITHKSFFNENKDSGQPVSQHNERLEFLGDAVLELSLSHLLMDQFPHVDEGVLSKLRASLVNEASLFQIAKVLNLNHYIRLGRGEIQSKGAEKPKILSSLFEAILGAIYLDAGFEKAQSVVNGIFKELIKDIKNIESIFVDYKTQLQELSQKIYGITPKYKLLVSTGPDHEKIFQMEVFINDQVKAQGSGGSKKQAAQSAAQMLLEELKNERV
ncbi:MAG: ribonuclease III [Bdellovibrionales bacterium]|nr:ribonuclease III [Bdellovibrionales bacterium]